MAHAQNFDPDDPVLAELREICLAFPDADEKVSHGRPCFFTKKVFAIYGGATNGESATSFDQSLVFTVDDDERLALEQHPLIFTPMYWGPSGWLGYDLSGDEKGAIDWGEVAELVEDSFRLTANKTQIQAFDAERS